MPVDWMTQGRADTAKSSPQRPLRSAEVTEAHGWRQDAGMVRTWGAALRRLRINDAAPLRRKWARQDAGSEEGFLAQKTRSE
jgi:hypothetical protein